MTTMKHLLLLSALVCICYGEVVFFRGRPKGGLIPPPRTKLKNPRLPEAQWFDQWLDHFNGGEIRTWKQRFFVNDTYYKSGGPVFLMIGGEGEANPIWMIEGQWIKYAQKFNALCLMLEHRFYGQSRPTPDMGTKNLQYLSSRQALADLATFRIAMQKQRNLPANTKWIAFGGSYPGSLAVWFRIKFPHLIDGAVATSAPVFAKIDFQEYLEVVNNAFDSVGSKCNKIFTTSINQLSDMLHIGADYTLLESLFRLCDKLSGHSKLDEANLFSTLLGNIENVVQYNKDNRAFEGAAGTNVTIDTVCDMMTNESLGMELYRLSNLSSYLLNAYDQKCLDFKYNKFVKSMQQMKWNDTASEGGRQWTYQTCTEFGYFQTTDSDDQPFGRRFSADFFIQQCKDIFGGKYNEDVLIKSTNETNANYGGFGMKVTNVVFPNGSIDPWHRLGVIKDLNPSATAVFINGTAHCANMYPDSDEDPPALKQAREKIVTIISQWISSKDSNTV